jgi:hypothetical protein
MRVLTVLLIAAVLWSWLSRFALKDIWRNRRHK